MTPVLSPAFDAENDIIFDGTSGQIKIVWFVDYTCPRTRAIRDIVLRSRDYFGPDRISLAIRVTAPGPEAEIAARAAIAAHWQGAFRCMHLALFKFNGHFDRTAVTKIAQRCGLDVETFQADLFSERTNQKLAADAASERASPMPPKPAVFVDGLPFEGPWDEEAVIDAIERPMGVRLLRASHAFLDWAASAGFVLVCATLAALAVANFGGLSWYEHLRHLPFSIGLGDFVFALPIEVWVNDGLMALFFLLVGIEIKREFVSGELSTFDKAILPIIAAVGGMLVPAGIYFFLNQGLPTSGGWGVPMATDIAFTLGLMALLGTRVPSSLKVFVSALAIADDLGAIVVIALFYGHGFDIGAFVNAAFVLGLMFAMNFGRVFNRAPYVLLFVVLWYFIYESGLHATLAGVLTAAAIPSRRNASIEVVALHAEAVVEQDQLEPREAISDRALKKIQASVERLREPGFHLQNALEHWSSYLILPLFAFFNTGILIFGSGFQLIAPETLGVILGLILGKPLGIVGCIWIVTRLGIARLSSEISWMQMIGAGFLAGIGFTMSIFIASAAFDGEQLASVKLAVLIASTGSAVIGMAVIYLAKKRSVLV